MSSGQKEFFRHHPFLIFLALAVVMAFLATVGTHLATILLNSGASFPEALHRQVRYIGVYCFMAVPCILNGAISGSVAERKSLRHGLALFVLTEVPILIIYWKAYRAHVEAAGPTSATLSLAFAPFFTVPLVLLAFIVRILYE